MSGINRELNGWDGEPQADRMPISGLFVTLYRSWVLIVIVAGGVLAASVATAFLLPVSYKATTELFPTPQSEMPRISASSLLGLGNSASETTDEALTVLTSQKFLGDFLVRRDYLRIFYADRWDPVAKGWKKGERPGLEESVREFSKNLGVETKPTSTVVTVNFVDSDPVRAARILNELIEDLNHTMQVSAVDRSESIVREYNAELQSKSVLASDVREHLVNLITDELKNLVSARASQNFAFRVLDPAHPPDRKSAPLRGVIVIVGLFLGVFLGILVALGRNFFAELRRSLR